MEEAQRAHLQREAEEARRIGSGASELVPETMTDAAWGALEVGQDVAEQTTGCTHDGR